MPTIFLRSSGGNDENDGLSWATAKFTLNHAALAATSTGLNDGGTVYVSKNHIESTGSTLVLCYQAGLPYDPLKVICVDDNGNPPNPTDLATGAKIVTTGVSHLFLVSNGFVYYNGISFIVGSGAASTTHMYKSSGVGACSVILENCMCHLAGNVASSRLFPIGAGGQRTSNTELINTSIQLTHVNQGLQPRGNFVWRDTDNCILGPIIPNIFFRYTVGSTQETAKFSNLDLSRANISLIDFSQAANIDTIFSNCKFADNVSITTGTVSSGTYQTVTCINCDSSGVNYQYYTKKYQGEIFDDDSVVATDGSTISRKMISSTGANLYNSPLYGDPLVVYNTLVGYPLNAAVEIINSGVTLRNDEIWLEVEYPSSSTHTLYARASDGKTHILATSGNQTLSTTAWLNTGGFSSPIRQTLDVDFTPMMSGLIYCTVKLARPDTTVYYDRKLRLSVI